MDVLRCAKRIMQQSDDVIGYARVSTTDQNLTHQIDALLRHGIPRARIFSEKVSGAARNLPERAKAIKLAMRPGSTLVVWKLDRLGRSLRDVVNIAHDMDKAGAYIRTLDGVDTSHPLTGKLMLGMLALMAEFERGLIAARTKSAMASHKARGAQYGGKVKFDNKMLEKIGADLRAVGPGGKPRYTIGEVAKRHGVSRSGINIYFPKRRPKRAKSLRGRPPMKPSK